MTSRQLAFSSPGSRGSSAGMYSPSPLASPQGTSTVASPAAEMPPHPLVVEQQVRLHGRATRHKNVLLCPVGALALYLSYRFQVTQEFLHDVDWTKNETWFYVKLLVDPLAGPNGNFSVPMKTDAYGKAMKKVQQELHKEVMDYTLQHFQLLYQRLGMGLLQMGQAVLGQEDENSPVVTTAAAPPPPPNTTTYNNNNEPPKVELLVEYGSLHAIYNQWFGLCEFSNSFPGGIAGMEAKYGKTWRSKWEQRKKKKFSRCQRIIGAMERVLAQDSAYSSIEGLLSEWNEKFVGVCRSKVSNFEVWLKEQGFMETQKARGKFAAIS